MSDSDIDPEGFIRFGGDCICGPVYTYGGICDPGSFHPECPVHYADAAGLLRGGGRGE